MKHSLKRLMALFCCLAITMTMLPAIPVMAEDTVEEITTWESTLTAGSVKLADGAGTVTLPGTIPLTGDLTIDLNGQTLTGTTVPFFKIAGAYTLTIKDSSGTAANEYTDGTGRVYSGLDGAGNGYGVVRMTAGGGKFVLEGGTITGHTASTGNVGAVRMNTDAEATFEMRGGKITGNTAAKSASAVMVYNNTFIMSGGEITGNIGGTASSGQGAIWLNGTGTMTMTGGKIYGNTHGGTGANVYAHQADVTITISGGTVGAGTDTEGVYLNAAATVAISGDAKIGGVSGLTGGGAKTNVTISKLEEGAEIRSTASLTCDSSVVREQGEDDVYVYTCKPDTTLEGEVDATKLAAGGEYTLTGNVTLSDKVTLTGDLTIDLAGCSITGPSTPFFTVPAGTTLTIKDSSENGTGALDATDISTNNSNGIVYVKGIFNLYGGKLTGRIAPDYDTTDSSGNPTVSTRNAGGVHLASGSSAVFNMYGGEITGNSGANGSGVLSYAGTTVNMYGGSIHDNYAQGTGSGNGGGIWAAGTLNMTGGSIYNNTTKSGGNNIDVRGTVSISGGTVGDGDDARSVYLRSGSLTLSDDVKILGKGLTNSSSLAHIENLTEGAEIHATMKISDTDSTVQETETTEGETTIYTYTYRDPADENPNLEGDLGADAFAVPMEYTLVDNVYLTETVTLSEGEYTIDLAGNTITGAAAPYFKVPDGAKLTIKDSSGTNAGKLDGSVLTGSAANGLVWVSGTTGEFVLESGTISGHTTSKNGAGVYSNGTFAMSGGIIEENRVENSGTSIVYGAGVYNNGTMTMTGGEIRNNSALGKTYEYGVGVYVGKGKSFTMSGGTISGNKATNDGRGAVYLAGTDSVFTMTNGTISGNTEKFTYGGAVMARADSTFKMQGGTITGNSVSKDGGAVYGYSTTTIVMTGGTISGNTATDPENENNGNEIYTFGPVTISGGTLGTEGVLDTLCFKSYDARLTITGDPVIAGIVNDNTVDGFDLVRIGNLKTGASVISAGELDFGDDETVTDERLESGAYKYTGTTLSIPVEGAVELTASTTFTPGTTYYLTSDVELAGAVTLTAGEYTIYLDGYTLTAPADPYFTINSGAILTIEDRTNDFGTIRGLKEGTNEMIKVSGTLNLNGGVLTGHTRAGNGGAIRVYGNGTFTMNGGEITGNTAKYGGALYGNGTQSEGVITKPININIKGGTISGNTATTGGSALYMNAGNFTMTDGTIEGNTVGAGTTTTDHWSTIRAGGVTMNISGGEIGPDAWGSKAVQAILVAANGNPATYTTLTISGNPKILGGGVKLQTASNTVTIGNLTAGADIVVQGSATVDPADETVDAKELPSGEWRYSNGRTLRVLSIGNSYSRDSFYYLPRLSQAVGMPIEAAYLYKGSCTIQEHAELLATNPEPSNDDSKTDGVLDDPSVVYSYYKTIMDPELDTYGDLKWMDYTNVAWGLADGEWDVVMLHQGTTTAGFAGTYNSDIDYLVDAIRAAQPRAQLYWNMIWAFDGPDTGRLVTTSGGKTRANQLREYYNNDQATMYNAIVDVTADNFIGEDAVYADDFAGWFPVGTAIQSLRDETKFGDNLTRDGYHLSYGGGRLTAAMTILKVLRPEADLSLITAAEIAPYLDTTDDRLTDDVEEFTDVFTGSEEQLAMIRAAVTAATTDQSKAPAKLDVTAPVTVEQATGNAHETVAQATAPMKLHFPDVAALSDGTVIVGAYENVNHTPDKDNPTETGATGFGYQGAGRLIIWTGDKTGTNWNYDEPLLVIDQKKLEEWGVVSLYDRYAKLTAGTLTADTYVSYSDPRDPNLTVAYFDADGDSDKDEVLLLTFWCRNFLAKSEALTDTYLTWSLDGGKTWATPQAIENPDHTTVSKRGDIAVFDDGQILVPTYRSSHAYGHMLTWNGTGWAAGTVTEITLPDTVTDGTETTEVSFAAPDPSTDVVYAMVRDSGAVLKSEDRGESWTLIANEDNVGISNNTRTQQPGFALIDENRVFATWARAAAPRNTIGKIFEVNNDWGDTAAEYIYNMSVSYDGGTGTITGSKIYDENPDSSTDFEISRDAGDPSAELLADGHTMFVVTYDTAYRAIVGSRKIIDGLSGTVTASTLTAGGDYMLTGDMTVTGAATLTGDLTIDLGGYTVTGLDNLSGRVYIKDSSYDRTGKVDGAIPTGAVISGGTFDSEPAVSQLADDDAYIIKTVTGGYQVVPGFADDGGAHVDFKSSLNLSLLLAGENGVGVDDTYTVTLTTGNNKTYTYAVGNITLSEGAVSADAVTIQGIAAKEMRDAITVTVTKGGETYYSKTVSVYGVANGWYEAAEAGKYKTMLADMINYGAAASNEFRGTELEMLTTSTAPEWDHTAGYGVSDATYAGKVSYTLSLKDKIQLNVYIDDANAVVSGETFTTYKVTHPTLTNKNDQSTKTVTLVSFDDINVVNADEQVSFTVTLSDGSGSFTVTYSIRDYVVSKLNGSQSAVVQALQKYVESVSAYIDAANS